MLTLTPESIERMVCAAIDKLDKVYLQTGMLEQQYDVELAAIDKWEQDMYDKHVYGK